MRPSKKPRVRLVQGRRLVRPEVVDLAHACSLAAAGVHLGAASAMRFRQSARELGLGLGTLDEIDNPLSLCDALGARLGQEWTDAVEALSGAQDHSAVGRATDHVTVGLCTPANQSRGKQHRRSGGIKIQSADYYGDGQWRR